MICNQSVVHLLMVSLVETVSFSLVVVNMLQMGEHCWSVLGVSRHYKFIYLFDIKRLSFRNHQLGISEKSQKQIRLN